MSTFGQLLKEDRERMSITQDALGKLLDVSQQTIAQWEQDKAQPRRERLQHLLQILGARSALRGLLERPTAVPLLDAPVWSEQHAQDTHDLAALLPRELRLHLNKMHGVGGNKSRYDYLSPNLVAMVKRLGSNRFMVWHQIAPEILRLAVARQVDEATGLNREHILFVVRDEPVHFRIAQRLYFEAGVMGVTIIPVRALSETAQTIQRIETDGPLQPDPADPSGASDLMADFDD